MFIENVSLREFSIVGISIRTTNENGQSQKDIDELWAKFMSENIAARIPNKASDKLYCMYTDYESDFMGAYTTILGFEVNSAENLPDGLITKIIPASTYRLYKSTGGLPGSVINTWKHIWEGDVKRKYLADFDIYPADAFSSPSPLVETYLSV